MKLQESGEMYLETIFVLSKKQPSVRSIDVATEMGFSKPSVSRAMTNLKKDDYILIDKNGFISLTEKGQAAAEKTYERHQMLSDFFIHLGVNGETAAKDACKIEHVISDETFEAIKRHAKRVWQFLRFIYKI